MSISEQEYYATFHRAEQAGITILNEMGLDPGIDHLLAMDCFNDVKELGGKVKRD